MHPDELAPFVSLGRAATRALQHLVSYDEAAAAEIDNGSRRAGAPAPAQIRKNRLVVLSNSEPVKLPASRRVVPLADRSARGNAGFGTNDDVGRVVVLIRRRGVEEPRRGKAEREAGGNENR